LLRIETARQNKGAWCSLQTSCGDEQGWRAGVDPPSSATALLQQVRGQHTRTVAETQN